MAHASLVAVSYPVDREFAQINTSVLDGLAEVAFLHGVPDAEFLDTLRQADVLIGWHLGQELPAGALQASPGLRLIQLLSAGADSVDFAAIPERLTLASNVGAYAEPMAEYVMAMALALARRLPEAGGKAVVQNLATSIRLMKRTPSWPSAYSMKSRMSGPYWKEYSPQVSLTPSSLSEYSPPSS
jgi:phosphoglycerate dehydrogenase-like enzyme